MSDLKVLRDDILVARFIEDKMTLSGILITTSVEAERRGKVLAVGPKVEMIRVGDIVHLPLYKDREIKSGNRVAELHPESNIIAKYE